MYITGIRRTKSEGSICTIRMLISSDDRTLLTNQDLESILLNHISHSLGNPTPSGFNQTSHYGSRKTSCSKHNFFGTMMRRKPFTGHTNHTNYLHQNRRHSAHKIEEFSRHIALTTHHTGLLLSLPSTFGSNPTSKPSKTVHFLVGKHEDYDLPSLPDKRPKRSRLFFRHSVSSAAPKISLTEGTLNPPEEVMRFPLRRSVSLGLLSERQKKCMDIVFQHTESHVLDSGKKTLAKRLKRVNRGFNLTDMHWISRKYSMSSGISLKSAGSYEAAQVGEMAHMSLSLKIQTDVSL
ncbi:unnamed protein product [Rodentolepis nana]|uniref:Ribosomal protein S10 n=1 Tax=Rodentolepis nana TaxID=102285 RepID=A0A0R3T5U9_RODNA|nr:unnamed protein product [Rodentolepis nana]